MNLVEYTYNTMHELAVMCPYGKGILVSPFRGNCGKCKYYGGSFSGDIYPSCDKIKNYVKCNHQKGKNPYKKALKSVESFVKKGTNDTISRNVLLVMISSIKRKYGITEEKK